MNQFVSRNQVFYFRLFLRLTIPISTFQVLVYNPNVAAFKISWQTYATATKAGSGWRPVVVKHSGTVGVA